MKTAKVTLIIVLGIFFGLLLARTASADYVQSDLEGEWYGHGLYAGNWHAWYHSTMTVNSSGDGTETWFLSNGQSDTTSINQMIISKQGIITSPDKSSLHGSLSPDKNILILTGTYPEDNDGMYLFMIYVKAGSTFVQSDLEGIWYGHSLTSGDSPEWEHSSLTVDNQGSMSYSSLDSEGDRNIEEDVATMNISTGGIIGISDNPSFHGAMSLDKNIFVGAETGDENEFILHIFVKGGGEFDNFAWTETEWYGHGLYVGDWEAWQYDFMTCENAIGEGFGSYKHPHGFGTYTIEPDELSNEGIMTSPSTPGHGVISKDKNIYVYTDTYALGENKKCYYLYIYSLAKGLDDQNTYNLYFPHIASNNRWETEIGVINTSSKELSGKLLAYSDQGNKVSEKDLILSVSGRQALMISEEFSNPENIGYIVFKGDASSLCGYTKFYQDGLFRVAVPAVRKTNVGNIFIPHIASNDRWWTGLALVNTNNTTKTLDINFSNGETKHVDLEPGEHKSFNIKFLFGDTPQPDIASAVITGGSGVIGLELFSGENTLSGVLLKDQASDTLYFPHVASNENWWTGIAAYNPNSEIANLTVIPYEDDGKALVAFSKDISPRGKYLGNPSDLELPENTAWFKIESSHFLNGFELFGTSNGNQLAGYSAVKIDNQEGVFPKLDREGWTGIAFVNTSDDDTRVTLSLHDDKGTEISQETINLRGFEKVVDNPENIFGGNITAATYMKFSSNSNVVGFQLNGSTDGMMLDGLPGM